MNVHELILQFVFYHSHKRNFAATNNSYYSQALSEQILQKI